jgi:hypothetical protein
MKYPWEPDPLADYITFMNTHLRVVVYVNGTSFGSFAVVDEGVNMNVDTAMPDGTPLVFKVEGHPRTTDPVMTATELVNYVLTNR